MEPRPRRRKSQVSGVDVQTLIVVLVAGFAALISGITGFGYGVIAMSVLPLFLSVRILNPVVTVLSAGNSAFVLGLGWRHVRLRPILPLFAGALVGIPLGVFLLARASDTLAKRILGTVIAAYVIFDLIPSTGPRKPIGEIWGAVFGLIGGALGGAFATGGPPVVVFFSLRGMGKEQMRSSLAAYFILTYLYKIPLLILGGFFNAEVARQIILLAFPTALGVVAGQFLVTRLSNPVFRRVLLALLAVTSVKYVLWG
jgi:uncharacterized protein